MACIILIKELKKNKYTYFSKQNIMHNRLFVVIHIYPIKKHYNIEEYVLTNAGYKYSAVINDLK